MGISESEKSLGNNKPLEQGKVNIELLQEILENINKNVYNKEVRQSPEIGVDCAVMDFEDEYLLVSADPITGATSNIGELVVDVNANDIYASNGVPVGIILTILMPVNSTNEEVSQIMSDISEKCSSMNISIIGGHTEVTDAVVRPVVSATILGKTKNRKLLKKQSVKDGFDIVLTKHIALEGTNILACDYENNLVNKLTNDELFFAKNLTQFLSISDECKIAFAHDENIFLHDVTEGGVFGGLYEMFEHLDLGFEVNVSNIPVLEVTKKICNLFEINPYKLISSGSLLIACENGQELVDMFRKKNIVANVIGKVTKNTNKVIVNEGKSEILQQPSGDDLFKINLN